MQTPDTTHAVTDALGEFIDYAGNVARGVSLETLASAAIEAHNKKMAGLVPELTYEVASGPPEWFEPLFASGMAKGFNEARRLILGEEEA